MRGIFTGICTSCVSLSSACCYPLLSHIRYFAPGGQKQRVPPGDGANISCFQLSCPETSQKQAFTLPAHFSPHSTADTMPDCTEKFQSRRYLKTQSSSVLSLLSTSNSKGVQRSRDIMLRPVNTAFAVYHSSSEPDLKPLSCLFTGPFIAR